MHLIEISELTHAARITKNTRTESQEKVNVVFVILATGVIIPRFRSQPPDTLLEPHWVAAALVVCWFVRSLLTCLMETESWLLGVANMTPQVAVNVHLLWMCIWMGKQSSRLALDPIGDFEDMILLLWNFSNPWTITDWLGHGLTFS